MALTWLKSIVRTSIGDTVWVCYQDNSDAPFWFEAVTQDEEARVEALLAKTEASMGASTSEGLQAVANYVHERAAEQRPMYDDAARGADAPQNFRKVDLSPLFTVEERDYLSNSKGTPSRLVQSSSCRPCRRPKDDRDTLLRLPYPDQLFFEEPPREGRGLVDLTIEDGERRRLHRCCLGRAGRVQDRAGRQGGAQRGRGARLRASPHVYPSAKVYRADQKRSCSKVPSTASSPPPTGCTLQATPNPRARADWPLSRHTSPR